jgi:hypothetical protein
MDDEEITRLLHPYKPGDQVRAVMDIYYFDSAEGTMVPAGTLGTVQSPNLRTLMRHIAGAAPNLRKLVHHFGEAAPVVGFAYVHWDTGVCGMTGCDGLEALLS